MNTETTSGADVLHFIREHSVRLSAGAVLAVCVLVISFSGVPALWVFLLGPVLVGALIPLFGLVDAAAQIDRWDDWFAFRLERAQQKDGKLSRYFSRPLFSGTRALWCRTRQIQDATVQAAVRLCAILYFWALMTLMLVMALYVVVAIVMLVIALAIAGWIMNQSGGGRRVVYRTRQDTDFFGNRRDEHFDDSGRRIGERRPTADFFGRPKTEHFDAAGVKTGESRETSTLFGDPKTEHFDVSGSKTGESRHTTTIFDEPVVEHFDRGGHKTGETRFTETLFGETVAERSSEDNDK